MIPRRPPSVLLAFVRRMSGDSPDVVFKEVADKGVVVLNRPKALNALNLSMVEKLLPKLTEWETTRRMVLVKGAGGRAFCAGGDVRSVVEAGRKGDLDTGMKFFSTEYATNALIGRYKIPYIALIDGIVMGGGVGLSIHGRYRVATERTLFAMPETQIGLFPDVGGSYFLPKMPGALGRYLALTGCRLSGVDVLRAGVATHFCKSERLGELEDELLRSGSGVGEIDAVLNRYGDDDPGTEFTLAPHLARIDRCFAPDTVEEIVARLKEDGSDWARDTVETLSKMSPTSLKVTLKELRLGEGMELPDCLRMELGLAMSCLRNKDFYEGVRALLIDKDQKPRWDPPTLEQVSDGHVDSYFAQSS